jgi:PKHD-type hydroxylase
LGVYTITKMADEQIGFTEKIMWECPTELPPALIMSMRKYIRGLTYETAKVNSSDPNGKEATSTAVRKNDVAWIAWDEWIPGIIHNMMVSANDSYFKYDLTHFESRIQSTIYNGNSEDFYTWHVDNFTQKDRHPGEERKLSCTLVLTEPDEYEGGELQICYYKNRFYNIKPKAGTCIVFPSWVPHRVRPVKSGQRISLVAWMKGPMFK